MTARILFVTGKLAEPSLRDVLATTAAQAGFEPEVCVLGISVAALMTPQWVARQLEVPEGVSRVVLPGWCEGDLSPVEQKAKVPVELGPKDLRDLPEHFGAAPMVPDGYGGYDIEIIAEVNHCPRLTTDQIMAAARQFRANGADVIDVGCDPGSSWGGVSDIVRRLRDEGFRVSIDSFDRSEIQLAANAGAELVLSVNGSNVAASADWGVEVVAVPDDLRTLAGLDRTIEQLERQGIRYRLDPVIEPIGFGFAASLGRYLEVRRRWPHCEIMMGIGNLSELTDVDSAGVNALLVGFCQELGIRSVLTTEVIPWARSSVREVDVARRLMHYAVQNHALPKRIERRLVMLRDAKVHEHGLRTLAELAARITDPNFRVFAEGGEIHIMNSQGYWHGADPFELFDRIVATTTPESTPTAAPGSDSKRPIDPSHAFYLGYEMAKAVTALTLGKEYRQDQALEWGFLTRPEASHRLQKAQERRDRGRPAIDPNPESEDPA
jgi:dihydropteroate synthase